MRGYMRVARPVFILLAAVVGLGAQEKKDYPLQPVPFTRVSVTDEFWRPRIETNRTVTIPFILKKMRKPAGSTISPLPAA